MVGNAPISTNKTRPLQETVLGIAQQEEVFTAWYCAKVNDLNTSTTTVSCGHDSLEHLSGEPPPLGRLSGDFLFPVEHLPCVVKSWTRPVCCCQTCGSQIYPFCLMLLLPADEWGSLRWFTQGTEECQTSVPTTGQFILRLTLRSKSTRHVELMMTWWIKQK